MKKDRALALSAEDGFSLIELLVVVFLFALMVLLIDAVFATVNRGSRSVEIAADIQQNGRVAVERLTREIRESMSSKIQAGSGPVRVSFTSARLQSDNRWFCVDVPSTSPLYSGGCLGGQQPGTTYGPIPQAWIVYWFQTPTNRTGCATNTGDLRRVVTYRSAGTQLSSTPVPADPSSPPVGDIIATCVTSFTVTFSGTMLNVALDLAGTAQVQGSNVPVQTMRIEGRTFIRN